MSKIWVRQVYTTRQAESILFKKGLDFDDLKSLIAKKLKLDKVTVIYGKDNAGELVALRPGSSVPKPTKGKVGGSDDDPYLFAIHHIDTVNANGNNFS